MEFPKKSKSCESHRNTSVQADCQECSDLNVEKCGLCGKVFYASVTNNIPIEGNLNDVCQCFGVSETDLRDATIEARESVQTTELPVTKICDSVSNVQLENEEISRSKETSKMTEEDLVGSSGESENLQFSHSSNGYLSSLDELSSQQNFRSPKNTSSSSEDNSKRSKAVKSYSSSGYPLSLGDQSPEQNLSDYRNITSPSSGEESKNTEREFSLDESENNTDSNKLSGDYLYTESSQSNENSTDNKRITGESDKYSVKTNSSIKEKNESVISPEGEKIVFNNPEIISKIRPPLPSPFPQVSVHPQSPQLYQLFPQNSSFNMPIATPHPQFYHQPYSQPFQSYSNPIMNVPVVGKNVPGRFPVSSRPQLSTPYYPSPQHEGNKGLSKKLLSQVQTQQANLDQNNTKTERIKDWLDEIELLPPPEQPPPDSNWASGWSIASNEENEGIPPIFSGTSTDERSSTEISEEENLRQRLLRRPPRYTKRGKPK